jgi:hypothetical protein
LPPRNVRPPERVWPQAWEIASLRLRGLMERIAHTRIPEGLSRRALLLKYERL